MSPVKTNHYWTTFQIGYVIEPVRELDFWLFVFLHLLNRIVCLWFKERVHGVCMLFLLLEKKLWLYNDYNVMIPKMGVTGRKILMCLQRTSSLLPFPWWMRELRKPFFSLFFLQWLLLTIGLDRPPSICLWMGIFMSRLKQFLSVHFFDRERDCSFQAQTLLFPQKLPANTSLAVEWLIMSWSLNIFHCFDIVCLAGCRVFLYFFRVSIFIKYNVDTFIILNMWFVTLTFQFPSIKRSCLVTSQARLSSLLHFVTHWSNLKQWRFTKNIGPDFYRCCSVPHKHLCLVTRRQAAPSRFLVYSTHQPWCFLPGWRCKEGSDSNVHVLECALQLIQWF